jgi:hypothetical protein
MEPPPYEEIEINAQAGEFEVIEPVFHTSFHVKKRVAEINLRLDELGWCSIHPVECPEYMMEFEGGKSFLRASVLDAVVYKKRINTYLETFFRTKEELKSKIDELMGKGIAREDITDYKWKNEECNGTTSKSITITDYYVMYQTAVDVLVRFIETTTPEDGQKIFTEKNTLTSEKIGLLVSLRQSQLKAILDK